MFFFFKQKTAYEMRIRDGSSDVCSSDLPTLLESMNRRARLQLRLQQTVEGLSVAANTYYLASLVGYLAKGAKAFGLKIDPELATAAAIPLLALAVWYGLRRLHRHVRREDGVQD